MTDNDTLGTLIVMAGIWIPFKPLQVSRQCARPVCCEGGSWALLLWAEAENVHGDVHQCRSSVFLAVTRSSCHHRGLNSDETAEYWRHDGDGIFRRRSCLTSAECSPFASERFILTLPSRQTARHPQSPGVLGLPGNSHSSELHTVCLFRWFIQM